MGLCASATRNSHSAVKLDMPFVPSVDTEKQKQDCIGFDSRVSPFNHGSSRRSNGSKVDIFLDSQAWLDSDCDDDFCSAYGDFTPSRGSTPVHGSAAGTPISGKAFSLRSNGALIDHQPLTLTPPPLKTESTPSKDTKPQIISLEDDAPQGERSNPDSMLTSPTDNKRKLIDLFRESRTEGDTEDLALSTQVSVASANERTPDVSRTTSDGGKTPNGDSAKPVKESSLKTALSCLPRLVTCRSFSEKKRSTGAPISMNA